MNIFEEALTGLGVEVIFDENNMFSCELNNDENEEDKPLLLSFYRDDEAMSLRVSVVTRQSIPENASFDFFIEFGEKALEPLRGDIGAGICPGTKTITLYKVVPLAGKPQGHMMEVIESLIEAAEEWDLKVLNAEKGNASEDASSEDKFNFISR